MEDFNERFVRGRHKGHHKIDPRICDILGNEIFSDAEEIVKNKDNSGFKIATKNLTKNIQEINGLVSNSKRTVNLMTHLLKARRCRSEQILGQIMYIWRMAIRDRLTNNGVTEEQPALKRHKKAAQQISSQKQSHDFYRLYEEICIALGFVRQTDSEKAYNVAQRYTALYIAATTGVFKELPGLMCTGFLSALQVNAAGGVTSHNRSSNAVKRLKAPEFCVNSWPEMFLHPRKWWTLFEKKKTSPKLLLFSCRDSSDVGKITSCYVTSAFELFQIGPLSAPQPDAARAGINCAHVVTSELRSQVRDSKGVSLLSERFLRWLCSNSFLGVRQLKFIEASASIMGDETQRLSFYCLNTDKCYDPDCYDTVHLGVKAKVFVLSTLKEVQDSGGWVRIKLESSQFQSSTMPSQLQQVVPFTWLSEMTDTPTPMFPNATNLSYKIMQTADEQISQEEEEQTSQVDEEENQTNESSEERDQTNEDVEQTSE